MAKKKSTTQLVIMLVLIAVILAVIFFLPSAEKETPAQQTTEQEDTNASDSTTLIKAGQKAPDFTVELFDGKKVSLSEMKGKVVLLNFWATWCPPCRQELARVQTEIIDRFAGKEFVFLPISRGETREEVAAFREKMGYTFAMGLDPEKSIYNLYATNYIPRNFLIDAQGNVVLASIGYEAEEFDSLIKAIEKTLK